jgi:hypothetical protein
LFLFSYDTPTSIEVYNHDFTYVQKNPAGELLEKVVSSYKHVLNAPMDEDTLMRKCQAALINFDELNKAYGNNSLLGKYMNSKDILMRSISI